MVFIDVEQRLGFLLSMTFRDLDEGQEILVLLARMPFARRGGLGKHLRLQYQTSIHLYR